MSAHRTHYTPDGPLAAVIAAHRAACCGDGRAVVPTVLVLHGEQTSLPPGSYRVEDDGTLIRQDAAPVT